MYFRHNINWITVYMIYFNIKFMFVLYRPLSSSEEEFEESDCEPQTVLGSPPRSPTPPPLPSLPKAPKASFSKGKHSHISHKILFVLSWIFSSCWPVQTLWIKLKRMIIRPSCSWICGAIWETKFWLMGADQKFWTFFTNRRTCVQVQTQRKVIDCLYWKQSGCYSTTPVIHSLKTQNGVFYLSYICDVRPWDEIIRQSEWVEIFFLNLIWLPMHCSIQIHFIPASLSKPPGLARRPPSSATGSRALSKTPPTVARKPTFVSSGSTPPTVARRPSTPIASGSGSGSSSKSRVGMLFSSHLFCQKS